MRRWFSGLVSCLVALSLLLSPLSCAAAESAKSSKKNAALRLLEPLYADSEQNALVYSPLSLACTLSMAAAGAQGETRAQLDTLLGSTPEWSLFIEDMAYSGVSMAASAFLHPQLTVLPEYESALDEAYDASITPMVPGNVMAQVNDWAAQTTDGMVSEMLSAEPDERTLMLLVSALCMKAEWASPFSPAQTVFTAFHAPDGDVEVSTMQQLSSFAYKNVDGVQAISLPYRDSLLQMTVLLPGDGDLSALVHALCESPDTFLERHLPTEQATVFLSLPNVRAESSLELKDVLIAAGVSDAFDADQADFSAMAENAQQMQLHIGRVLQKTVLNVNEAGTESAVATMAAMRSGSAAPSEPVEMNVDHPFLLLINDPDSGYVLFAACVNNPA